MTTRITTICALALGTLALSAGAAGAAPEQGHPSAMSTSEHACWELNTVRDASADAVQAALPEGWLPRRNRAGFALTMFVDYACEEFTIDGRPARRTIVSWLVALAQHATTGERRSWTIAHASDNPLYVQRLRKLGVDSRYLPRASASIEAIDGATSRFAMDLDGYTRTGTAPEPTGEMATAPGGVVWFPTTDGGAVRLAYVNHVAPATLPTITETFQAESAPAGFGIADITDRTARGLQVFLRGSWTGELTRHGG